MPPSPFAMLLLLREFALFLEAERLREALLRASAPLRENLNRMTSIGNVPSGTGGSANITYTLNNRNQRTAATKDDGSYWNYTYDSNSAASKAGQVTAATYYSYGDAIPGLDTAYTYDDMGNRKTATNNAVANSTLAFTGNYYVDPDPSSSGFGANLLNQYGSRDVPRVLEEYGLGNNTANLTIIGTAPAGANVTVTSSDIDWTGGETYWYGNLTFSGNNMNGPLWTSVNITANLSGNFSTVTGNMYLPANPEVYSYDADGDLLADGRWNYIYDAENRLAALVTTDEAHSAGMPRQSIAFGYDSQNRRIGKVVFDYNAAGNGTWVLTQSVKYLYDGYNLIAEMNAMPATPTVVRTYAWGSDLSGSMSGAGGVGGLLMANLSDNSTTKTVYYGYDANGNIITLADTSGNIVASYDYDPFGNTVRATGSWALFNNFRFSTRYNETSGTYAGKDVGLYMYPERPYSPSMARWLTRDPSEEAGGLNLYGTGNDLVNGVDPDGENVYLGISSAFFSGDIAGVGNHSPVTHYALVIINPPTSGNTSNGITLEISYDPNHWTPINGVPQNGPSLLPGAWKVIGGLYNGVGGSVLNGNLPIVRHIVGAVDALGQPSQYTLRNVPWFFNPKTGKCEPNLKAVSRIYETYEIADGQAANSAVIQAAKVVSSTYDFALLSNCGFYVYRVVQAANLARFWPALPWSETNFGLNGGLVGQNGTNPVPPSVAPTPPSATPPAAKPPSP